MLHFPFYAPYVHFCLAFALRRWFVLWNGRLSGVQPWQSHSWQDLRAEICPPKGIVFQSNVVFSKTPSFWVVVKLWDSRGKSNALQVLKTIWEIIYDNLRHKLIQKELEGILVSQYVRKTKGNWREGKKKATECSPAQDNHARNSKNEFCWGEYTLQFCIVMSAKRSFLSVATGVQ